MYDYPEISECIWYSLSKNILCFCQAFRILFILIFDPLTQGSLSSGIHHWGRRVSASLSRLCCLRRTTVLHPFFLIGEPKVLLKKSWRALLTLSICGEDGILKYIWSFIYYVSTLMASVSPCVLPFELEGIPVGNYKECGTFIWTLWSMRGEETFLSYGLYAHL